MQICLFNAILGFAPVAVLCCNSFSAKILGGFVGEIHINPLLVPLLAAWEVCC